MKNLKIILVVVVVIVLGIFIYYKTKIISITEPIVIQESPIKGCYLAGTAKDVYTLNIQSEVAGNIVGTLAFKNFEKDSSSGTYKGIYSDGILLGDYSFASEGMDSVMQVIFKKSGDDFIRGYGDVNMEGNRFTNLNNITYDSSSSLAVFKKGECSPDL